MDQHTADLRLSSFKFLDHIDSIAQLADGKPVSEVPPVTVEIDPTNVCNSNCWWCSTANTRRASPGGLTAEEVHSVISQAADLRAKSVVFKGGGDPTLQPYLADAIRHSSSLGLAVGINTNGARMSQDLINSLVANAAWIRFSVDAGSAEVYQQVHRTRDFERVAENIRNLTGLRNTSGSELLIGINNCLDQYNTREPEEMLRFAYEMGVDYAAFRPAYFEIAPTPEARRELIEIRKQVMTTIRDLAERSADYPALSLRTGNIRNGSLSVDDPGECRAPALTMIVMATGEVAGCCDLRGKPGYSFGNIREASLLDIWQSQRRAEVFSRTSRRECDKFCSHAYAKYNQVIEYLSHRPQGNGFL